MSIIRCDLHYEVSLSLVSVIQSYMRYSGINVLVFNHKFYESYSFNTNSITRKKCLKKSMFLETRKM